MEAHHHPASLKNDTFLRALARIGLWPFVVYRLLLGAALVAMILLGGASAGA